MEVQSTLIWGRSILINSNLTSILMYTLGFCWLPEGTQKRFDFARGRFFWEGVGNKKPYHMVKWEALATPKRLWWTRIC